VVGTLRGLAVGEDHVSQRSNGRTSVRRITHVWGGRRMRARGEGKSSGARNASLEIADDRAKDARCEKAWPQRTGPILTERRKLS
jgi:hypothetical protein